ncbi:MAG: transcriptional repressor LexA [Candidatus Acetothermia bacterium]|jgi:repressor LexA|nr:transcriptional repressor LexA [Candidatus Acetothermia bacterium]MDH7505611.1 transcriptional repressor LexA [Candidatus Acetothermia bacterium]
MGRKLGPLTERQQQVLEFIVRAVDERGLPPTIREIGRRFGLASTVTVWQHLRALERKGYIRRREGQARGIELVQEQVRKLFLNRHQIPLVGRVAAGKPILAVENIEGFLSLEELFPGEGNFALRVQGDSMKEADIKHGDILIVRQQPTAEVGEIVVAIVNEEEATVKRLARIGGRLYLKPANDRYEPIPAEGARIVGKVIGSLRRFR